MGQVGLEAVPLAQVSIELSELVDVDLSLVATAAADHMLMVRVLGQVIQGDAVVEVGVGDEAEILE